jgi:hypothetical protein
MFVLFVERFHRSTNKTNIFARRAAAREKCLINNWHIALDRFLGEYTPSLDRYIENK